MSAPTTSHVCLEFLSKLVFPLAVFAENQDMQSNFYVIFNIQINTFQKIDLWADSLVF